MKAEYYSLAKQSRDNGALVGTPVLVIWSIPIDLGCQDITSSDQEIHILSCWEMFILPTSTLGTPILESLVTGDSGTGKDKPADGGGQ